MVRQKEGCLWTAKHGVMGVVNWQVSGLLVGHCSRSKQLKQASKHASAHTQRDEWVYEWHMGAQCLSLSKDSPSFNFLSSMSLFVCVWEREFMVEGTSGAVKLWLPLYFSLCPPSLPLCRHSILTICHLLQSHSTNVCYSLFSLFLCNPTVKTIS